jgi:hypothetical protein
MIAWEGATDLSYPRNRRSRLTAPPIGPDSAPKNELPRNELKKFLKDSPKINSRMEADNAEAAL